MTCSNHLLQQAEQSGHEEERRIPLLPTVKPTSLRSDKNHHPRTRSDAKVGNSCSLIRYPHIHLPSSFYKTPSSISEVETYRPAMWRASQDSTQKVAAFPPNSLDCFRSNPLEPRCLKNDYTLLRLAKPLDLIKSNKSDKKHHKNSTPPLLPK